MGLVPDVKGTLHRLSFAGPSFIMVGIRNINAGKFDAEPWQ